jgi:hypothetical protein
VPDWCGLQWPPSTATFTGVPTEMIYGQVFEPDVTNGVGQGLGVTAQAGYGPDGSDPAADAGWEWTDATYNVDFWANDEYMTALVVPSAGTFDFAYRFSVDGGTTWLYCDLTGSTDGYAATDAGALEVTEVETVDWCNLQWPAETTISLADPASEVIYGRVHEPGITDSPGEGPGVLGQVGLGPDGTDPATAGWTWWSATYNVDDGAANDEYEGQLTATVEGSFDFAYRFSLDDGTTWVYCDRTGSSDGYSSADAGTLTVTP